MYEFLNGVVEELGRWWWLMARIAIISLSLGLVLALAVHGWRAAWRYLFGGG